MMEITEQDPKKPKMKRIECKDCGRSFVYDTEKGLRAFCEHVCKPTNLVKLEQILEEEW